MEERLLLLAAPTSGRLQSPRGRLLLSRRLPPRARTTPRTALPHPRMQRQRCAVEELASASPRLQKLILGAVRFAGPRDASHGQARRSRVATGGECRVNAVLRASVAHLPLHPVFEDSFPSRSGGEARLGREACRCSRARHGQRFGRSSAGTWLGRGRGTWEQGGEADSCREARTLEGCRRRWAREGVYVVPLRLPVFILARPLRSSLIALPTAFLRAGQAPRSRCCRRRGHEGCWRKADSVRPDILDTLRAAHVPLRMLTRSAPAKRSRATEGGVSKQQGPAADAQNDGSAQAVRLTSVF